MSGSDNLHGFTESGLAALNRYFHSLVDDGKLPNVVMLIARHGQIVYQDAYGILDVTKNPSVPVKLDTIFRIASMTKPIVGVGMMILYEEGKWTLEDPVSKFIPEFKGLKVKTKSGELVEQEAGREMKMKHLMSHTAGFGSSRFRKGNLQNMIDELAKLPLDFQPGTEWIYGPSVDIQGYILEKLSGQTLDVFLEERLFKPLGMVDTAFFNPLEKAGRISKIHKYDGDGKITTIAGNMFAMPTSKPEFLSGGGGLCSTAPDYWRFTQMLLNHGTFDSHQILKPETVKLMHTSVLEPNVDVLVYPKDEGGLGFGMDFAIIEDPVKAKSSQAVQSYYWGGLFLTWFWIDPVNDLVVVGMTQQIQTMDGKTPAGAPDVREGSAKLVYAALKKT